MFLAYDEAYAFMIAKKDNDFYFGIKVSFNNLIVIWIQINDGIQALKGNCFDEIKLEIQKYIDVNGGGERGRETY